MLAKSIKILLLFLILQISSQGYAHANLNREVHTSQQYHFSTPVGLESKVEFWKKIYSEYSTDHYVVHDIDNLGIIYEIVYIKNGSKLSSRAREIRLDRVKKKYKKLLLKISRTKQKHSLKGEDKRVYKLVKSNFRKASRRIRYQIGQKNRFREGIERSGMFKDRINQIFSEFKLPLELTVLPHVESSFQVNAYSSAGAAGIWQFTRGTGRLFMKVGYDVDERRDPILSTIAAAKLLKANYKALQSWPLAITAYNHGTQGMKNAKKRHGASIVDVINGYRSRSFGFASKNFYAEFLAALHVIKNQNRYFQYVNFNKPLDLSSVVFKDFVSITDVMTNLNMTRDEIAKYNPALRKPVISGQKRIPRNFTFQGPQNKLSTRASFYQIIPASERHKNQIRSKLYTVRRGDTLSEIASRFRTSVNRLHSHNSLSHRNKIYIGQVLRLPSKGRSTYAPVRLAKQYQKKYKNEEMIKYQVRRNDNLTKIANRFNTEVSHLVRLNKIKYPNQINPGRILRVPFEVKLFSNNRKLTSPPSIAKLNTNQPKQKNTNSVKLITKDYKIKIAHIKSVDEANQVRPAFLPVSFSNRNNSANPSQVGVIVVDFDETLSHYADWSKLSTKHIMKLNNMTNQSQLNIHSKIKVPFLKVKPDIFEEKRQEFHKAIQEDFFNNFKIDKLLVRNMLKGETAWEICNEIYSIPFWLLASYNSGKNINSIPVGEPIVIPLVSRGRSS
ncbi:MAG TPA: LysM peptidoglycan-binding domain-containing protein [Nitrospinaceae bacterium]|nr:LysM peptidoglycan-binding domain-containing protein [Nitrospinaceae bacterium]